LYKRLNPDPERIKAIIPVHLYGQMTDMDPVMELAGEFGLKVIEDAAQAIGSEYEGRQAGTIGDFGCFSFFPSKNLGAYGDGGLLTVKDPELAVKATIMRLHGAKPKYHHSYVGINSRLDALQAAILGVKLPYLDDWSRGRQQVASWYNQYFREAGLALDEPDCMSECSCGGGNCCRLSVHGVILPKESTGAPASGGRHIYHQYTIRVKDRDGVAAHLSDHGIGNAVYYPVPLHVQDCFADLGYQPDDCPAAMCASLQAISLPVYPELTEDEVKKVVKTVKEHTGT
jgi:dTDP-4-amino-4,6-dideoxygalactose transaminase